MKIFDLHCDTPFRMYRENLCFDDKKLDTNIGGLSKYDSAVQVFAVWSDYKRSGEQNYSDFFKIRENLGKEIAKHSEICILCTQKNDLDSIQGIKLILSVEGASLLCGDISRLRVLFSRGVRVLTIMWRGENEAGGGHDTDTGLTDFGKKLIAECEAIGVVPDVSHMSQKAFWDTVSCAKLPFIASHSNSSHLCRHTRNLSDNQFRTLVKLGGLCGINLYPPFLSHKFEGAGVRPDEYFSTVCNHIEHFLSLGGEKCICLGGDRDGFDSIPEYSPIEFADKIYGELLKRKINEKTIKDIFFGNADRFFRERLPQKERI